MNRNTIGAREIALWIFLGCVVLAIIAGVAGLVIPGFRYFDKVFGTIALLGGYSLVAMIASLALDKRKLRPLSIAGLVLIGLAALFFLTIIWDIGGWQAEQFILKTAGTFLIIGSALVHAALVFVPRTYGVFPEITRYGALAGAWLGSGCLLFLIWGEPLARRFGLQEEFIARVVGLGILLALGGLLMLFIIARLEKHTRERGFEHTIAKSLPVPVRCPRCAEPLVAPTNRWTRCAGCRLKIRVEVEEPRCTCGYVLYQLESDTCPECGKSIPEEDRWKVAQKQDDPAPTP